MKHVIDTLKYSLKSLLIPIIIGALLVSFIIIQNGNVRYVYNYSVTDKGIKRGNKTGDKYLIYTEDENDKVTVFEITDSIVHFRFNSSDIYGSIRVGSTYNFKVCGHRIPIISMYSNILEYEEVKLN